MTEADKERYSRQILFPEIGARGQERLLASRAVVVGCGALGSFFTARYNIAERGYWPLVIVAAMVIATPLPLLQRALALTIGVFLINAFTLMQVASLAFVSFRLADAGGESEVWRRASTAATGIFNSELPRVVAVLLMWAIVARPAKTIDTSSARAWFRRLVRQRESSAAASKDERSP